MSEIEQDNLATQKNNLRKRIKVLKAELSLEEKRRRSVTILQQLEQQEAFQKARTIMIYWSMPDEVQTHDFVEKWYLQKQIILPSVCGDELELRIFEGKDRMKEGQAFCILEPTTKFTDPEEIIDLIVVPGVAFDKENNRMGRGRGFYDKLLTKSSACKIGICFDFQLFEKIPVEHFDIPMDLVITESKR